MVASDEIAESTQLVDVLQPHALHRDRPGDGRSASVPERADAVRLLPSERQVDDAVGQRPIDGRDDEHVRHQSSGEPFLARHRVELGHGLRRADRIGEPGDGPALPLLPEQSRGDAAPLLEDPARRLGRQRRPDDGRVLERSAQATKGTVQPGVAPRTERRDGVEVGRDSLTDHLRDGSAALGTLAQ